MAIQSALIQPAIDDFRRGWIYRHPQGRGESAGHEPARGEQVRPRRIPSGLEFVRRPGRFRAISSLCLLPFCREAALGAGLIDDPEIEVLATDGEHSTDVAEVLTQVSAARQRETGDKTGNKTAST